MDNPNHTIGNSPETSNSRDHLFDITLTSLDVNGQLHIPKNHVTKHFPELAGDVRFSLSSSTTTQPMGSTRLLFLDSEGKKWRFTYASFGGSHLGFTDGWAQFVKEKGLVGGDTVSFWKLKGKSTGGQDGFCYYIGYHRRVSAQLTVSESCSDGIEVADQVFDEMPKRTINENYSEMSIPGQQEVTGLLLQPLRKVVVKRRCVRSRRDARSDMGNKQQNLTISSSDVDVMSPFTACSSPVMQDDTHEGEVVCQFKGCTEGAVDSSALCKAHGAGSRCAFSGCTKGIEEGRKFCQAHDMGKRCMLHGGGICTKGVHGSGDFCKAHGGGKRCVLKGCTRAALGSSSFCSHHGGGKRCALLGCKNSADGLSEFCVAHGGGVRCSFQGCTKAARGSSSFCIRHGGGKRCTFLGCSKSAAGSSDFCVAHGGGIRCSLQGCTMAAQGSSSFCVAHGSGKRCTFIGCTKSTEGPSEFCITHGGGKKCASQGCHKAARHFNGFCIRHGAVGTRKRCKFENCRERAYGGDDFCKAHGGGKQCSWEGEEKCDNFALKRSALCSAHYSIVDKKETREHRAESSGVISVGGDGMGEQHPAMLYCALFPEDYEFEKDTLVQLWMAEGFFEEELWDYIAGQYFERFVFLGYIKSSRTDLVTGKTLYTFNRKNLSDLSSGSHVMIDSNSDLTKDLSMEVSHVSVRCCRQIDSAALNGFKRFKQLQTLMFLKGHNSSFKQVPRDLLLSLELLQVLDLSQTHISELPNSVANMKCLRYLDLSQTLIRRLPETVDHLNKLQTLKLKGCSHLSMLPKGMRKLVNLRHLDIDVLQLRSMPKGMGNLTNLQTLPGFIVDIEENCSIGQLKNMNNLTGSFCILRLENVLTEDEAIEACLCNKSQLVKLELHWSDSRDEEGIGDHGKVLSSLQPYQNIEELQIVCYGGFELSSWVCDPAFSKLVSITFFKCENCIVLPSLGQLPSLKFLNILEFPKLKVIDHNFYGGIGNQGYIAFPRLEKLTIENMLSLEEWTGTGNSDFPCLLKLTFKHCPKLYSICTLSTLFSLKNLEISHCKILESCPDETLPASVKTFIIEDCPLISARFLKNGCQDWPKIAHVPNVWIDHQEIPFGQRSIQEQGISSYQ